MSVTQNPHRRPGRRPDLAAMEPRDHIDPREARAAIAGAIEEARRRAHVAKCGRDATSWTILAADAAMEAADVLEAAMPGYLNHRRAVEFGRKAAVLLDWVARFVPGYVEPTSYLAGRPAELLEVAA